MPRSSILPALIKDISYTYDLTSTLQCNLTRRPEVPIAAERWTFNDRFAWNHHMLEKAFGKRAEGAAKSHWVLPLVNGHVDQASAFTILQVFPCATVMTLLRTHGSWSCRLCHAHRSSIPAFRRSE